MGIAEYGGTNLANSHDLVLFREYKARVEFYYYFASHVS